ncbi:MAG TPA: hypothetical protein VJS92_07290 [Candidatus Polarisedimenticolaceae bacterium]|nr:hypothetical protein [Candidatus Polarisedimenticolaceae bacterium]
MNSRRLCAGLAASLLAAAALPALAGIDVDLGGSVRIGDSTDLFFAISSRYFGQDRHVVEQWAPRYADPDDLAVALYVQRCSSRPLDAIFDLRHRGLSWWDISVRLGVPADVWFVPVARDPGPPYGRAYGHWKNHKRDKRQPLRLEDDDIHNLVAVRMIHEYYNVPVEMAMQMRSSGENVRTLMSDEYKKRHAAGPKRGGGGVRREVAQPVEESRGPAPSKTKSKGKGHK